MYITYPDDILRKFQLEQLQILKSFSDLCEKYDISWFPICGTLLGTIRHQGFIPWDDDIDIGMLKEDYEKFLNIPPEEYNSSYGFISPETGNNYYNFIPKFYKKDTTFATEISLYGDGNKIGIFIEIFPYAYVSDSQAIRMKHFKHLRKLSYMLHETTLNNIINHDNPHKKIPPLKRTAHLFVRRLFSLLGINSDKINQYYVKFWNRAISPTPTSTLGSYCYSRFFNSYLIPADTIFPLQEGSFENLKIMIPFKTEKILKSSYGNDFMQIPPPEKRWNQCPAYIKFSDGEEYDFTSQSKYTDNN